MLILTQISMRRMAIKVLKYNNRQVTERICAQRLCRLCDTVI